MQTQAMDETASHLDWPDADPDEQEQAAEYLRLMAEFARIKESQSYGPEVKAALIEALLSSRSRYTAVMITDLCDLTDRINSPGTVGPHNWSFRLPPGMEAVALRELAKLQPLLKKTARC